jgi:ribosomal protein S18 acetylase RimI-like enzyme
MGGWSRLRKQEEMSDPNGRFLLLSDSTKISDKESPAAAFLYFQFLMEDSLEADESVPVLYVLELAVERAFQGLGLGRSLMASAERIASSQGMEKVVLTVFKNNLAARKFYAALGYTVDEISSDEDDPSSSTLILSKSMHRLVI